MIRSALVYLPSVALPRAAAFLTTLILARFLAPAEFGLFALVIVLGELMDAVFCNWARLAQMRLDSGAVSSAQSQSRTRVLTGLGFFVAAAVLVIFVPLIVPNRVTDFLLCAAAYLFANGLLRNGLTVLRSTGSAPSYSLLESVRAGSSLVALGAALILGARTFEVLSLSVSSTTLVTGVIAAFLARPRSLGAVESTSKTDSLRARFILGLPLALVAAAAYGAASLDRIALQLVLDSTAVGLYAAVYALGRQPADILSNAVNVGAFPELIRKHEHAGRAEAAAQLRRIAFLLSIALLPLTAILAISGQQLVGLFFPQNYVEASGVLWIVGFATYLMNLKTFVFDQVFHLEKRNWLQFATLAPVAAVTGLAVGPLVTEFGLTGAAASYLLGAAAGLVASAALTHRYVFTPSGKVMSVGTESA